MSPNRLQGLNWAVGLLPILGMLVATDSPISPWIKDPLMAIAMALPARTDSRFPSPAFPSSTALRVLRGSTQRPRQPFSKVLGQAPICPQNSYGSSPRQ